MFYGKLLIFSCLISSITCRNNLRRIIEGDLVFPDALDEIVKSSKNRDGAIVDGNLANVTGIGSLEFARRLNEVDNIEDIISEYSQVDEDVGIESRFSSKITVRNIAKSAICTPEMTVVSLISGEQDPHLFHIPMCTRVLRCGGCCNNILLQCEPVSTIEKTLQIFELNRTKQPPSKRMVDVNVVEHTKCKCSCVTKATDCNIYQVYHQNMCKCVCKDGEAERNCNDSGDRIWNSNTCTCECLETSDCSSGTYFDNRTCSCRK